MTAGHDPDDGAVRQARAYSAEMYLRLLVEAELRRAVGYWRLGLPGAGSAPRPVPAAGEGMDRVRAAAEALTAIGAIEDVTAHSVLTEFTSALAVRSKVPLRMLNEVPLARWNQRRLPPVSAGTPDERLLDSIAENLLWSSLWHDDENPERSRLAAMAAALRGASAVKPSSPALARYAALSRRLRIAGRGESHPASTGLGLAARGRTAESNPVFLVGTRQRQALARGAAGVEQPAPQRRGPGHHADPATAPGGYLP